MLNWVAARCKFIGHYLLDLAEFSPLEEPNRKLTMMINLAPPEKAFPLQRLFYSRIIPGLVLSMAVLMGLALWGVHTLTENIYLSLAANRAETIELSLQKASPAPWRELIESRHPDLFIQSERGAALMTTINNLLVDSRTDRFKLYNANRVLLYSPQQERIGEFENKATLDPVFRRGIPLILPKEEAGENELYIPLLDSSGQVRLVFELYEKSDYLDELLFKSFLPTIIVPTLLFWGLFTYLTRLIKQAQTDIDERSDALISVRKKLEQFVSFSTIKAASIASASATGEIQPVRIATTIYYSDIRSFSSLADSLPPAEVIDYLNRVMSIQIEIIKKYGGDVDKLIGDAVLAQFDGAEGERSAVLAAEEIIDTLLPMELYRGIGIGIQAGDVLACSIGSEDRKDFTIIGDTVNLAARLCAAAKVWEIVVEERTLRHSGCRSEQWSEPESIQVKGHEHPLEVSRLRRSPTS
ncbi:adenylate/guanylate cyclase domain-containing protein [Ectothiorhodospiraceae bacterium BW-2]|nr:adenylate/guanylate cyclase domain-containing protein [Ectothiorhodospiraceae bacterium BW-2]